jgi:predicted metal-dependent phosphoesterase TrpH
MRIDLHCHSEASSDCRTKLEEIPLVCAQRGIEVLALTDHNQIWGAQKLKEIAPPELTVIVGEEVYTAEGEIIGLFLTELIPRGLSPEETLERIHAQGGISLLPHGFDPLKPSRLQPDARHRVQDRLDIIEGLNGHVSWTGWNAKARRWATAHDKPTSAGSDAHRAKDIGSVYLETPSRAIETPADLIAALRAGQIFGKWRNPVTSYFKERWAR